MDDRNSMDRLPLWSANRPHTGDMIAYAIKVNEVKNPAQKEIRSWMPITRKSSGKKGEVMLKAMFAKKFVTQRTCRFLRQFTGKTPPMSLADRLNTTYNQGMSNEKKIMMIMP